jgi:hypothetical protein
MCVLYFHFSWVLLVDDTRQALDHADRVRDTHPHLTNIFSSSRGIIFLGTPHRGSDSASLSKVVASVARVALPNTNLDLIRNLKRDSQTLDRIRDSFSRMLDKHSLSVWSFVEELPIKGTKKVFLVVQHWFLFIESCLSGRLWGLCRYR